jgi:putative glycosyltransferase (TIGR04372 family)
MRHSHYGTLEISYLKFLKIAILTKIGQLSVWLYFRKHKILNKTYIVPSVNTFGDSVHQFHQSLLLFNKRKIDYELILVDESPAKEVAKEIFENQYITYYREPLFSLIRSLIPSRYRRSSIDYLIHYHLRIYLGDKVLKFNEEIEVPIEVSQVVGMQPSFKWNKFVFNFLSKKPYHFKEFIKYSELISTAKLGSVKKTQDNSLLAALNLTRPYVCLHIKEKSTVVSKIQPRGIEDPTTYITTINYFVSKGYQVVLMGKNQSNYQVLSNCPVINYSGSELQNIHNDFILIANCVFYCGNNSGPYSIALACKKPLLMVNFFGLCESTIYNPLALYLIKKIFIKQEARFLTVEEFLDSEHFYHHDSEYYIRLCDKVDLLDNSSDEVLAASVEFIGRLEIFTDNGYHDDLNDTQQRHYLSLINPSHLCLFHSRSLLAKSNFS